MKVIWTLLAGINPPMLIITVYTIYYSTSNKVYQSLVEKKGDKGARKAILVIRLLTVVVVLSCIVVQYYILHGIYTR